MYKLIHFFSIILLNYSVYAINLPEALSKAYTNNSELQSIRQTFLNEIEQFSDAASTFLPSVNYEFVSDLNNSKQIGQYARPNSQDEQKRQQGQLVVEQSIFNGGSSVLYLKAAQSTFRAARAKYYADEQKILLNLIRAYFDCYEAKEKYEISEISVKANKQQLETVEEKLKLGEATLIDLANARAGSAAAETNKLTSYANYQAAEANFIRLFGIAAEDIDMPTMPENLPNSLESCMTRSVGINPSIDSSRHSVKSHKAVELAAKADLLPKVSLSIKSGKNIDAYDNQFTHSVTKRKSIDTTLSVKVPIYSRGAEYSKIRKAKIGTRQAVVQLDEAIKQVKASTIGGWKGLEAAKSKIIATTHGVEAAQIAYDGTKQEEIVGSKTILDVLTAEEKLYHAKISKVDAHKDAILAAYQIKALLGELTAKSLKLKVKYFVPEDAFKGLKKKLIIGF